jgi:hypothetical protein
MDKKYYAPEIIFESLEQDVVLASGFGDNLLDWNEFGAQGEDVL